mmetsp:Transcript_2206/g.5177  ORF Transcript_2206/g.5177 Transcript_2206/m.5177 type:complete len:204 (-) Transcript_2206:219-830(-)
MQQERRLEGADLLERPALHGDLGARVVQRLPPGSHHIKRVPEVGVGVVGYAFLTAQRLGLLVKRSHDDIVDAQPLGVRKPVEHELVKSLGHERREDDFVVVEAPGVALDVARAPCLRDGRRGFIVPRVRAVVHLERGFASYWPWLCVGAHGDGAILSRAVLFVPELSRLRSHLVGRGRRMRWRRPGARLEWFQGRRGWLGWGR